VTGRSLPAHELRRLEAVAGGDPVWLADLVRRRIEGVPLQYLEGTAAFGPLELTVDERVLIPRPETEQLWELARTLVGDPKVVIDLGTGSGALAIGLARAFPGARVLGVDVSGEALAVAAINGRALAPAVEWRCGDLFEGLPVALAGTVDLLVSNPPYVAEADWAVLPEDVRHEPYGALVAGPTGTEILDRIAGAASRWLSPDGWVVCEIGETQGSHVGACFAEHLVAVEVRRDLAGRDRFVIGRRP
jgi:release factor glutamine methyltransferase